MNNSVKSQRKQTTKYLGRFEEVGLEVQGNQRALSDLQGSSKRERENGELTDTSRLLDDILSRDNMIRAMKRVIKNKGSHGVDGMKYDELRDHIIKHWLAIKRKLLEGTYDPSPVRRVEIPKPNGGVRLLGIPTVLDRMLQQAIATELSKIYEPTFSDNSYGFRPNRSAQMAIKKAKGYINEGYTWVVDMDLEKFFDKVNHDILIDRLSKKVKDNRVLDLIRKYLESGIMINGIKVSSEQGTPQGGPLSPLLSNIMLDEVDKELEKRGHRFCRYADDFNTYVKSEKAGKRVMESLTRLIEGKLKLKVNKGKSKVDRVTKRKFLGFSFYNAKGSIKVRIHEKSYQRLKEKLRKVTSRNWGTSMENRLKKLNQIIIGWLNYFRIGDGKYRIRTLEEWLRRRLRACIWKQWKKIKTKFKNLRKLGIPDYKSWEYANTRKGFWRISKSPVLCKTLTNAYLENLGYISIAKRYQLIH